MGPCIAIYDKHCRRPRRGPAGLPLGCSSENLEHEASSGSLHARPPSYTADFLRRRDDSRDMLGRAFKDLPPGTIKTSIRLVTS